MNNIFEIKTPDDIEFLLKSSEGKFIVLSFTLKNTPIEEKIQIRKWLKVKSNIYSNVMFLYMCVDDDYFGKLSIIKENKDKYPLMYYIFNVNNICLSVDNLDLEGLNESFEKMKIYLDDTNKKEEIINDVDEDKIKNDLFKDKLELLENYAENYKIEFLNDIRKRKVLEES